jgi:energy-coupling factor transporter transmembrane protein EcfT
LGRNNLRFLKSKMLTFMFLLLTNYVYLYFAGGENAALGSKSRGNRHRGSITTVLQFIIGLTITSLLTTQFYL